MLGNMKMWGLSEYVNIIMEYCLAWQMYYSQTDNLVEILDIIKGPIYLLWTIFFPQEETWNEQQVSGEEPGSEEGGEGGQGEEDGGTEVWLLKKKTKEPICPMPDFNWVFPRQWRNEIMFESDVFSRKENKEIEQRTAVHQQVGEG